MGSVLMARSSAGKDVKAEKSNICEWVKLPAPSTVHIHPSLAGVKELPDTAGPSVCGSGFAEGPGAAEAGVVAGLEAPQLPKADWHPVPQYVSELPVDSIS